MRVLPVGWHGLLAECDDLAEVMRLDRALRASRPPGVVDIVPAARTLLLTFDPQRASAPDVEWALWSAAGSVQQTAYSNENQPTATVLIPVVYDGADLANVADLVGMPVTEVIRRHQAAAYTVAFVGFAPGFGYLVGGDPALHVPRRATPRTRVPAGSVALAGEFSGVYPREGPGGWQLIGHTVAQLWDVDRDPPALLTPGTPVRFVDAGATP